jgi:hypothetical protein
MYQHSYLELEYANFGDLKKLVTKRKRNKETLSENETLGKPSCPFD